MTMTSILCHNLNTPCDELWIFTNPIIVLIAREAKMKSWTLRFPVVRFVQAFIEPVANEESAQRVDIVFKGYLRPYSIIAYVNTP